MADKWWYVGFWLFMMVLARVFLVNPLLKR